MSDSVVHLIPLAPDFVPTPAQVEKIRSLLVAAQLEREPELLLSEEVEFIDPGENLEAVCCPQCHGDLMEWWGEAMDQAAEEGFSDLAITTPCCGARTSLNDLEYHWLAGFARFRITILNPTEEVEETLGREISRSLGVSFRVIRAHI